MTSLISPTDPRLNAPSREVKPEEISSPYIQGIIDKMLRISAGKGHTEDDSRQMVGLAAIQLGEALRIITINLTADGSNKKHHLEGIRFPDRIPEDKPERLHWVEPAEFESYRKNWENWPNKCPRKKWDEMKQ